MQNNELIFYILKYNAKEEMIIQLYDAIKLFERNDIIFTLHTNNARLSNKHYIRYNNTHIYNEHTKYALYKDQMIWRTATLEELIKVLT